MGRKWIEQEIRSQYGIYGIRASEFLWNDGSASTIISFQANGRPVSIMFSPAAVSDAAEPFGEGRDRATDAIIKKVREHPHYSQTAE